MKGKKMKKLNISKLCVLSSIILCTKIVSIPFINHTNYNLQVECNDDKSLKTEVGRLQALKSLPKDCLYVSKVKVNFSRDNSITINTNVGPHYYENPKINQASKWQITSETNKGIYIEGYEPVSPSEEAWLQYGPNAKELLPCECSNGKSGTKLAGTTECLCNNDKCDKLGGKCNWKACLFKFQGNKKCVMYYNPTKKTGGLKCNCSDTCAGKENGYCSE